jgi:effector-binding domain-containing protein
MRSPLLPSLLMIMFIVIINIQPINAMENKKVEKQAVLVYTMKTTLANITTDPGNIPDEIMQKAAALNLEITGPQIWQYRNVDGNPNSPIDLDICVPIKEAKGDPGKFNFDVLPAINCIAEIHKGSYNNLMNTYQRIFGEMTRRGIPMGTASREVYLVCDFENQQNCVTEIQVIIPE